MRPARVAAARMGRSVVLIEPSDRVGGLTTGGLGQTDIGNKQAIGGIAREFYRAVKRHYADPAAWKWQDRAAYRSGGQTGDRRSRPTPSACASPTIPTTGSRFASRRVTTRCDTNCCYATARRARRRCPGSMRACPTARPRCGRPRVERGGRAGGRLSTLRHRLRIDRAAGRAVFQSAGAGLPVGVAHRLRRDSPAWPRCQGEGHDTSLRAGAPQADARLTIEGHCTGITAGVRSRPVLGGKTVAEAILLTASE